MDEKTSSSILVKHSDRSGREGMSHKIPDSCSHSYGIKFTLLMVTNTDGTGIQY
jgi:hypothetical protein